MSVSMSKMLESHMTEEDRGKAKSLRAELGQQRGRIRCRLPITITAHTGLPEGIYEFLTNVQPGENYRNLYRDLQAGRPIVTTKAYDTHRKLIRDLVGVYAIKTS